MYISDLITGHESFRPHAFNLITAGCGAGKSYFVAHHLPILFSDVEPRDIIFVTSRAITVDQQAHEYGSAVVKFDPEDAAVIGYWNADPAAVVLNNKMRLMTYDKLVTILTEHNRPEATALASARIIVLDECHALVSDTFIRGIESVRVWLKWALAATDKICIGLTATPGILYASQQQHGLPLNSVLDVPLVPHKAKNLRLIDKSHLLELLQPNALPGKTLVLHNNRSEMSEWVHEVPGSALLVSASSNYSTKKMETIRRHIVLHSDLPKSLRVLFATTTLREGVTIAPGSDVRNIVTVLPDEMHVTQFLGRCRYDVENLIVVYAQEITNYPEHSDYISEQRQSFVDYYYGQKSDWFKSIADLVQCREEDVQIGRADTPADLFAREVRKRWLVLTPAGLGDYSKYIYTKEARAELVKCAKKYGVLRGKHHVTYASVIDYITTHMGYYRHTGRHYFPDGRHNYDVICAFPQKEEE